MGRWWGRRPRRQVDDAAWIEARNAEQAAEAHGTAAELWEAYRRLRSSVDEPLGRRFLAALQASWGVEHHADAPSPAPPVIADVLRRLGSDPDPALLAGFVAADHRMSLTAGYAGPAPEGEAAFAAELAEAAEVPRWLEEHRCEAHEVFVERVTSLASTISETTGRRGNTTAWTTSVRWWPGRPSEEPQLRLDPVGLYGLFRSLEERSDLRGWEDAWRELDDLTRSAEGLPPFDPVDWLLASWRDRPRRLGGLGGPDGAQASTG